MGQGREDGRVGGKDRRPLVANVVPDIKGDVRESRLGSRGVVYEVDANGVAVVDKPGQGSSGGRVAKRANEDTPIVGCTVADIIGLAVKDDRGRRDRRAVASRRGRHRQEGRAGGRIGRRGVVALRVGGSVRLLREPRSGRDHDLSRETYFMALRERAGTDGLTPPIPAKQKIFFFLTKEKKVMRNMSNGQTGNDPA